MGLDMYLTGEKFFTGFDKPRAQEDGFEVEAHTLKLGYWRKHPNLHGYIVTTFADGVDECQEINLGADDIRRIITAIEARELPHTEGFFFGASDDSKEERKRDVEVFTKALAWLEDVKKPVERKPEPMGAGMATIKIEPGDYDGVTEMRSVIYRASW